MIQEFYVLKSNISVRIWDVYSYNLTSQLGDSKRSDFSIFPFLDVLISDIHCMCLKSKLVWTSGTQYLLGSQTVQISDMHHFTLKLTYSPKQNLAMTHQAHFYCSVMCFVPGPLFWCGVQTFIQQLKCKCYCME